MQIPEKVAVEATQDMHPEQAADLAALQSEAGTEEQAMPQGQQEAPGQDVAAEIAGLVTMLVAGLKPALPSLEKIYTKETTETAAAAIAAVCNKHGWLQGGLFGEWGVEVAAAGVLLPLGIATAKAVKADIFAAKEKTRWLQARRDSDFDQHLKSRNPDLPPGASEASPKTVTFGTAIPPEANSENQ